MQNYLCKSLAGRQAGSARHKANTRHNALRATQTPTQRIKNALLCSRKSSLWRGDDEYQYIFRWRTDTFCGVVLEKRLFGQIKRTDKIQYYAQALCKAHRRYRMRTANGAKLYAHKSRKRFVRRQNKELRFQFAHRRRKKEDVDKTRRRRQQKTPQKFTEGKHARESTKGQIYCRDMLHSAVLHCGGGISFVAAKIYAQLF